MTHPPDPTSKAGLIAAYDGFPADAVKATLRAIIEAKALVEPYIVGAKHVRIRVVTLRRLLDALQASEATGG